MRISGIIFDCDGVLVQSESIAARIICKQLHAIGLRIGEEEAQSLFLGQTIDTVARRIEQLFDLRLSAQWMYELAMATAYGFAKDLVVTPGVHELLASLLSRGYAISVASQSTEARLRLTLNLTSLEGYFGHNVFSASMVTLPKPAPDLFLHAAKSMGVCPQDCLVIEDSPIGISAAKAAGMHVMAFASAASPTDLTRIEVPTFSSMTEIGKTIAAVSESPSFPRGLES